MTATITQAALSGFVLEWTANDPVELSWIQRDGAALDGTYVCQVRRYRTDSAPIAATLTVTTTVVAGTWGDTAADAFVNDPAGDHLLVEFALADSTGVAAGGYLFDVQESGGGRTRWSGSVRVLSDVTREVAA